MPEAQQQHSSGRDPAVVDSEHYTVEIEDDRVRVLRVRYAPGAKSVMHYHPAGIAIALSDARCRFSYPDGRSEDMEMKAGMVMPMPAGDHLPENLSDNSFEVILIELKG